MRFTMPRRRRDVDVLFAIHIRASCLPCRMLPTHYSALRVSMPQRLLFHIVTNY